MTTKTYKSYTIKVVGLSHHIYRPETYGPATETPSISHGYGQSWAEAKRWINSDLGTGK